MKPEEQNLAIATYLKLIPPYVLSEEEINDPHWNSGYFETTITYADGKKAIFPSKIKELQEKCPKLIYVKKFLPNYTISLDAMYLAEKSLSDSQYTDLNSVIFNDKSYIGYLNNIVYRDTPLESNNLVRYYSPSAAQRAEAFLKCLNLWKE